MGIKIIRLKGLHSNQKGSWDVLQKTFFYNRAFLLWIWTSNISAPFDWKSTKLGMGNNINPYIQWLLMALAEIPTMSENKARENGIFGFPVRDMAREYQIDRCNRRVTKKNFMKFRCTMVWHVSVSKKGVTKQGPNFIAFFKTFMYLRHVPSVLSIKKSSWQLGYQFEKKVIWWKMAIFGGFLLITLF